ncbi:hypothetical protein OLMES_0294 [Oleiphilus messinensis]|uniref:Uncharacterized protein n=1 Tax=Oleiphilus messinensis TaxID=141451 RepID=A0A1Y0I2B3_9GAMM|nr:hypothetical protein OLMES_0294 [Oleiphilus messinensis]
MTVRVQSNYYDIACEDATFTLCCLIDPLRSTHFRALHYILFPPLFWYFCIDLEWRSFSHCSA